jgi:endonuclease YncB( thermonuclease family)
MHPNPAIMKIPLVAIALVTVAGATVALAQSGPSRRSSGEQVECSAQGALPAAWEGQVYAIDGNTVAGVGLKPHIRLWGIQAPELRDAAKGETVAGMRARAALEDLLEQADHKVKCRATRFDRNCSMVAQCQVEGAKLPAAVDIGMAMIAAGYAYGSSLEETLPWEQRAGQRYSTAEAEARKQRRGLWKEWLGEK